MPKELRPLSQEQSDVWHYLNDRTTTEVFFGGGAGPGKSFLGCLFEVTDSASKAGSRGLIARATYEDLRKTTMLTFFEVCGMMGYKEGTHYRYNAQEHTAYWANGSITFFDHLQYRPGDPEFNRLGSREYTRVFVDEAPDADPKAIEVLSTRIRFMLGNFGTPGKMLLTGNSGDNWCKYAFVYDKDHKPVELPEHKKRVLTTYASNPDPEFRSIYGDKLGKILDPYTKARLMFGDWLAAPRTGKEFFFKYDAATHAKARYRYDPTKPIHLGFDFNRAPHMTLVVFQVHKEHRDLRDVYVLQGLKEYCLEHPFNKTESVCKAFLKDATTGDFAGHEAGVFVYGDYSGKTGKTTEMEGIRNDYDVVWHILGRFFGHNSDRVKPNPLHYKVNRWMNACFAGLTNVEMYFDPSMINTNKDFQSVKEDADGSMLKEYATDKITGKRYEKNGHCAQASYYIATSLFRDSFDAYKD